MEDPNGVLTTEWLISSMFHPQVGELFPISLHVSGFVMFLKIAYSYLDLLYISSLMVTINH